MKVRDETVFKPELSHPKATRNRDGSNFPPAERNVKVLEAELLKPDSCQHGSGLSCPH